LALRTDGINQYGDTVGYKGVTGSQNRMVCFWFKGSYNPSTGICGWGTELSGQRWSIGMDASGFYVSVFSGFRAWTPADLFDNSWHHVAVQLDGTNVNQTEAYKDGEIMAIASTVAKAINTGNAIDVRVGRGTFQGYGAFDIYDFRIYSEAKSIDDIRAVYNGRGCDSISANLELRLRFLNEESVCSIEQDLSGNNRHMTAYNKPAYVVDIFDPCPPAIDTIVYAGKRPRVLILNSGIDLWEKGLVSKIIKLEEVKTFRRDKIIVPQITLPVINNTNQFNVDNPDSIFHGIKWRYQLFQIWDEDDNLIWDGIVDDFLIDLSSNITGILSKNTLSELLQTEIEYISSVYETPAEAFENICIAYDYDNYNKKYVTDSIAIYTENNCFIKCHFLQEDNITFQQAIELLAKVGAADCYTAKRELCFKHWTPFTGGVKFSIDNSDLNKSLKSKLSRDYFNNYRIGYEGDLGVKATDSANGDIGKISRENNRNHDLPIIEGDSNQQIEIKDLVSAVYLGESNIRRSHINLDTEPMPPRIIDFPLPYTHKDFINLQTYFRLTNTRMGWDNKLFEVYRNIRDFHGRNIDIMAYEVDE
jgi:hypothetical protein